MARKPIPTTPAPASASTVLSSGPQRFEADALYRVRFTGPVRIGSLAIRAGTTAIVAGAALERQTADTVLSAERV